MRFLKRKDENRQNWTASDRPLLRLGTEEPRGVPEAPAVLPAHAHPEGRGGTPAGGDPGVLGPETSVVGGTGPAPGTGQMPFPLSRHHPESLQ